MCTVLLPPGVNPIAVNKYVNKCQHIYCWFLIFPEPHHNSNRKRPHHISDATRTYLEKMLHNEYELYYWLRARLLRQYSQLILQ